MSAPASRCEENGEQKNLLTCVCAESCRNTNTRRRTLPPHVYAMEAGRESVSLPYRPVRLCRSHYIANPMKFKFAPVFAWLLLCFLQSFPALAGNSLHTTWLWHL